MTDQPKEEIPSGEIGMAGLSSILRLDGRLGEGVSGTVYVGNYLPTNQTVAVKKISLRRDHSQHLKEIRRELSICMEFDDPHVCKVFCYAVATSSVYIIMEYIEGMNLLQFLQARQHFFIQNPKFFWIFAEALLSSLEHIHSLGIVHCDLKLENIMVGMQKDKITCIKLVDFGFCRRVDDAASFMGGTITYIAPEIALDCAEGSLRDIWSFGILIFEIVTFSVPYQLQSKLPYGRLMIDEVMEKLRALGSLPSDQPFDPFSHPSRKYSAVLPEVKTFIRSCLVVDQKSRPSAAFLKQRVLEILSNFDAKSEA
jgi:serine/threonine protein kinase